MPPAPGDIYKVLLVDDVPANLVALEAVLEPLGAKIVTAGSGEDALRRLLSEDFACILLDVQMPGLDGFETARLIRGRERTNTVPIIFVTAISREEAKIVRGYSEGAVDYVIKPFNPDVMRAKVAAQLREYRAHRVEAARLRALADDAEARARNEAHLERRRMFTAFMTAPFAMALLRGPSFVLELANQAALEIAQPPFTLGDSAEALLHQLGGDGFALERLRQVYAGGEGFSAQAVPLRVRLRAGGASPRFEERYFNVSCEPLRGADGAIEGLLLCAFDVSDQVRSLAEISRATSLRDDIAAVGLEGSSLPLANVLTRLDFFVTEAASAPGKPRSRLTADALRRELSRLLALVDRLVEDDDRSTGSSSVPTPDEEKKNAADPLAAAGTPHPTH